MDLTKEQREALLGKIRTVVSEKYYDPSFDDNGWTRIVQRHRNAVITASDPDSFEKAVTEMLAELSPRTLGLLSERTKINPRNAINASFSVQTIEGAPRWVFQDVLPGGVAEKAGVKTGDVLLTAAGKSMRPADGNAAEPPFEMGHTIQITVSRGDPLQEVTLSLSTGNPKYKDNPYSELTAVTTRFVGDAAYLRVSLFQGKVGIDFANELDSLFQGPFASSDKLIIDLRGNPGGGIGGLALMSYLTPNRIPVGYSKNREMAEKRIDPSTFPKFGKIPRSRLAIPGLALKFMGKTSVYLYTEGMDRQAFRGKTIILVNEHTTGAAEMVAQFAQENRLAKIVGAKTPGRLVSRKATKLGSGYRLVVPVAAYVSAKGNQIEGKGITPDVLVPWSFTDATKGRDNQLDAALGSF
jgi:C-terminal processing protease CtpA/Prc